MAPRKQLLTAAQLGVVLEKLAAHVQQEFPSPERLAILGIRTRGALLAERLRALLQVKYAATIPLGVLDITFYRDDLSQLGPNPMVRGSDLPFDLTDANVILVDDVLYTGRTVRAALNEISDYGRPSIVRLAIIVDRGLRQLPIQPDYCGLSITTNLDQRVQVLVEQIDNEDGAYLESGD